MGVPSAVAARFMRSSFYGVAKMIARTKVANGLGDLSHAVTVAPTQRPDLIE